ncbi:MAG: hypothetical protein AAGH41_03325 [Pseudomonadota bacterium]
MISNLRSLCTATVLTVLAAGSASASQLIVPVDVTASSEFVSGFFMTTFEDGSLIDQSSLSSGYSVGDSFDAFVNSGVTHNGAGWVSTVADTSPTVLFDFGTDVSLTRIGFFEGQLGTTNAFDISGATDANPQVFNSLATGPSYLSPSTGPVTADVVTLSQPALVRYVLLSMSNCPTGLCALGEVVFGDDTPVSSAVPVPPAALLMGGGLLAARRFRRVRA